MKRIKVFFSILLLFLALPVWRYMDMISLVWAGEALYSLVFLLWGSLFLVLPAWLLKPKLLPAIVFALVLLGTIVSFNSSPLSSMATKDPDHGHCGTMTFTGVFYPAIDLLTQAHADDLEARNQLCWIKKMIQRVPEKFTDRAELDTYMKLTQDKLMLPENKYRVSLPMVALLYALIFARYDQGAPEENFKDGKFFLESLKFWIGQYTVEISSRDYSFWDFPHGPYIKFEYGIVEKNWEAIVNSLVLEEE